MRDSLLAWVQGIHRHNPVPGISLAVYSPERWPEPVAVADGVADLESQRPLSTEDRFLAGSVGKTFFAALALHLVGKGTLDLDRPISAYLPRAGLPGVDVVTARMLLRHTSGYPEYDRPFMEALIRDPLRMRDTADWFGAVRRGGTPRPGILRYSDLNFIVLAAVLDAVVDSNAYDAIERIFLRPLQLTATSPATGPQIRGLVTGYDGEAGLFGRDRLMERAVLIYNPQFEWGGGGFVSIPSDLARWIHAFRTGAAFPDSLWPMVVARPPGEADTASSYRGLGVHIDRTTHGVAIGHSGYIPGYLSWVRWYDSLGLAVAAQVNATDTVRVASDGFTWLDEVAGKLSTACPR